MIKRLYIPLIILAAALTTVGCSSEEDNIFNKSAAERLNEISSIYTQRLCDSPGGWVMEYYPYTNNEDLNTGVGYLIMHRFHQNGSVYSLMKNKANNFAVVKDSSAWQVITDMGPVLTFNTWNNCMGRFSSPDDDIILTPGSSSSKDESGYGLRGDYEFVIVDAQQGANHVMLKGKKRSIYQRLTRIPAGTDFEAYLDDVRQFNNSLFKSNAPTDNVLTSDGRRFLVDRMFSGRSRFYPEGKDSVTYGSYQPFLVTKAPDNTYHLRFKDTIMYEGRQVEQEFVYNAQEDCFYGMTNSANTISPRYESMMSFFKEQFDKKHTFKLYRKNSSEMSDKMKDYVEAAHNAMHTINKDYHIDSLTVSTNGNDEALWQFRYQQAKTATAQPYKYNVAFDGNIITLQFVESTTLSATNIMNKVPAIKTLFTEVLSQRFIVEKHVTLFDLTIIRFTAEADPDLWFVINY